MEKQLNFLRIGLLLLVQISSVLSTIAFVGVSSNHVRYLFSHLTIIVLRLLLLSTPINELHCEMRKKIKSSFLFAKCTSLINYLDVSFL